MVQLHQQTNKKHISDIFGGAMCVFFAGIAECTHVRDTVDHLWCIHVSFHEECAPTEWWTVLLLSCPSRPKRWSGRSDRTPLGQAEPWFRLSDGELIQHRWMQGDVPVEYRSTRWAAHSSPLLSEVKPLFLKSGAMLKPWWSI